MGDEYEDFPEDNEPAGALAAARIMEIATACKGFGNKAIKTDPELALTKYQKALRYLDEDPDLDNEPASTKAELDGLRFSVNNNTAMANIKLEKWQDAAASARAALAVATGSDADRAKAHYRAGVALVKLKDEEAATKEFEAANKLAPNDVNVANELKAVKTRARNQRAKEKEMYGKFFA